MSGRAIQVLARFPTHFEAPRSGKQFGVVVEAMATLLDVLSTEVGKVRRSHRIGDAETRVDVERLGALHAIGGVDLDPALTRLTVTRATAQALSDAVTDGDTAARDAVADDLLDLFGVVGADPRLALFNADLDEAARRLSAGALGLTDYFGRREAIRARVRSIARLHARGNGTVRAIIEGAATALDLELDLGVNASVRATLDAPHIVDLGDELFHSRDLFWHSSFVRDRARLTRTLDPIPPATTGTVETLATEQEVLGIEENPLRREQTEAVPRAHAELFSVYRRGFDRDLLRVEVEGIENRTVGPMLVNRDEGHGIGFAGAVPDGSILVIEESGEGTLDDVDVTDQLFAWQGACFAANDDDPAAPRDFVFDGPGAPLDRRATFVVATPTGALDGDFVFPHAGDPVPVPGVGVGKTRYAFFVQQAHWSPADDSVFPHVPVPFAPRTHVGFLDASVFAADPGVENPDAAIVTLSWLEHEAYAVRVIIPKRFARFDGEGDTLAERVRFALERHRAVGIDVRVEYLDDSWILGASPLTPAASLDPILSLQGGSVLSPPPEA